MNFQYTRYLFLNIGHFIDHMFMLIFAKAAFSAGLAFGLAEDGAYASMIPYGIPSLVLFGACAPIAAHLADKWNRNGMIVVFFLGIGVASFATSFAENVYQIAAGLAALGVFAAIYHPVGIAMVMVVATDLMMVITAVAVPQPISVPCLKHGGASASRPRTAIFRRIQS